jgi:hypothetical protein
MIVEHAQPVDDALSSTGLRSGLTPTECRSGDFEAELGSDRIPVGVVVVLGGDALSHQARIGVIVDTQDLLQDILVVPPQRSRCDS